MRKLPYNVNLEVSLRRFDYLVQVDYSPVRPLVPVACFKLNDVSGLQ